MIPHSTGERIQKGLDEEGVAAPPSGLRLGIDDYIDARDDFLAFVAWDDGVLDALVTRGGDMSLFWDLIQQSQLEEQKTRAGSLETRVAALEAELAQTRQILSEALRRLEGKFGEDWDRDGRVG